MKNKRIFAVLTLFFLALTPNLHAASCSNATGAGRWEFTVTGLVILPTGTAVPVAQLHRRQGGKHRRQSDAEPGRQHC